MMNKLCFQAFDRTLRDITRATNEDNADKPFSGKVVVLGGDFRQILPVVRKGSRYDIGTHQLITLICGNMAQFLGYHKT